MSAYENAFAPDNVYGHALRLLLDRLPAGDLAGAVHLDVGCGYGAIAGPLTEQAPLSYVGVDADPDSVQALRDAGHEAHVLELGGEAETVAALLAVVGGRRIASITMLDVLEHLPRGAETLRALRRLAIDHEAALVISVPNVAHRDVGFKLAFGAWDYTATGLLDTTHVRFFTGRSLERDLACAGLYRAGRNDVEQERSDQHFPSSHPALASGTTLHQLLRSARAESAPDDNVNQFVWALAAGPALASPGYVEEREVARPFLSVVVRTQGRRLHCLQEALTCLAGQTDTDFEVLVMGHLLSVDQQVSVERVIEDVPESLRRRVRYVKVEHGNRVAPLNAGFAEASGEYIAILDDDDVPFAHWVEVFHQLSERAPGRLLRTVSVLQEIEESDVADRPGIRAVGAIRKIYPSEFDIIDHLRQNFTPNTAIAFPRGVFHDLGMRFDSELTTTEDWDFIMRAALRVGVASSPEITCIYHWWTRAESSRTVHAQDEWDRNLGRIVGKLDSQPVLLPEGSVGRIRALMAERDAAKAACDGVAAELTGLRSGTPEGWSPVRAALLRDLAEILESRSWRASAILRLPHTLWRRGSRIRLSSFVDLPDRELAHAAARLRESRSWRMTRFLRRG